MDSVVVMLNGKVLPCIEVFEGGGEWFVRVLEKDRQLTRSFRLESLALSYAQSQRLRLGLDEGPASRPAVGRNKNPRRWVSAPGALGMYNKPSMATYESELIS